MRRANDWVLAVAVTCAALAGCGTDVPTGEGHATGDAAIEGDTANFTAATDVGEPQDVAGFSDADAAEFDQDVPHVPDAPVTPPDTAPGPDVATVDADVDAATDAAAPPDVPADAVVVVDAGSPPDVVSPPDVAPPPDVAVPPDVFVAPDVPPDVAVPPDVPPPPDVPVAPDVPPQDAPAPGTDAVVEDAAGGTDAAVEDVPVATDAGGTDAKAPPDVPDAPEPGTDAAAGTDAVVEDVPPDVPDVPDVADVPDVSAGTDAESGTDAVANSGDAASGSDIGGGMPAQVAAIVPTAQMFDPAGIHEIKITLNPDNWLKYLAGVDKPDGKKEYAWYQADVEFDGTKFSTAGIKGFGNGSQIDNPQKPNIRVKFDQYLTNANGPLGEKAFRLKGSGQDLTFLREELAGAMVRAVGGSAPRFSWAHVTVNGEDYGPYILQESADKRYFKNAFNNNDGQKFEPIDGCEALNCPVLNGCPALAFSYTPSPGNPQQIVDLASSIATATDAELSGVLDKFVYTDEFLADYAVDSLLSNLDGFASAGQNFTFYVDQKTHRFHLIATGTDLTFGNYKSAWYELTAPWGPPNDWCVNHVDNLYLRIWQVPELKAKLFAKYQALQCGMFKQDTLYTLIDSYHTALTPFIYGDPKGIVSASQIDASYDQLKGYVQKRQQTLIDLLGNCP